LRHWDVPPALHEAVEQTTVPTQATHPLVEDVARAEAWAGEPFLHSDEDPDSVLAAGTARRQALDDALAEIESGRRAPSSEWMIRYALMLGL
jgi:hypothetical protein